MSVWLANKLQKKGVTIDVDYVSRLALLHDLFKVVALESLGANRFHSYVHNEEEITMWKELRQKFPGMHEGEGSYLMFKDDFPELAVSLRNLGKKEECWEETIVHYADWRVFQNKVVEVGERLSYLREAYPHHHHNWSEDEERINLTERKIFELLQLTPQEMQKELEAA